MIFDFKKETLHFIKPAKTSRGEYLEKTSYIISLSNGKNLTLTAEASPLVDLSTDGQVKFEEILNPWEGKVFTRETLLSIIEEFEPYPTLRFAFVCLLKKWDSNNNTWVINSFTEGNSKIEINGLVWMNDINAMREEALNKIEAGFRCIKLKVGALDFDAECRLIEEIRKKHSAFKTEIRLDANGAFLVDDAKEKLHELSRFDIHSIEQPIKAGQWDELECVIAQSEIDIALDEELIGLPLSRAKLLLNKTNPEYLILKPTLIGGFDRCDEWISIAEKNNIGWWSTSALEGNVGLYDIAQWVSQYDNLLPQGLGTGSLFVKNFEPKTTVEAGYISCLK